MGKLTTLLTILIFMQLFFMMTGQICAGTESCGFGGTMFNAVIDIISGDYSAGSWMNELIGNIKDTASSGTGILSLILGAGVIVAGGRFVGESIFYIPIGLTLALLASDFLIIGQYLISLNSVLGSLLIVPILTIYAFTVLEWVRGKD